MSSTPFCVTSRSLKVAKRVGIQRSTAMLASTRGPPKKPVCAAMSSSAPDDAIAAMTNPLETSGGQSAVIFSNSTAFSVLPSTCVT